MNVLVAYASRHGSTRGIAEAIADQLRAERHVTLVTSAGSVDSLHGYDSVVLGSGIYMNRWLPEACQFVESFQAELSELPVWLFSSGPLGNQPAIEPVNISEYSMLINVQDHTVFAGCLDPESLGRTERLVARLARSPFGDFRDWNKIRGWSFLIGHELKCRTVQQEQPTDASTPLQARL